MIQELSNSCLYLRRLAFPASSLSSVVSRISSRIAHDRILYCSKRLLCLIVARACSSESWTQSSHSCMSLTRSLATSYTRRTLSRSLYQSGFLSARIHPILTFWSTRRAVHCQSTRMASAARTQDSWVQPTRDKGVPEPMLKVYNSLTRTKVSHFPRRAFLTATSSLLHTELTSKLRSYRLIS